ncbi:hypothetical protein N7532_009607 [Penicillium argentinense]|uniref:Uncharacterized protein n=1 Tax=Penicillium argentinense TaxID=1131581 RepID=A0A9W9EZN8_9EURO|nr:uncharacterized protein N7532_009607 [Penicillium argentinense]KAJ5090923.1 hypothetical protein N7532_009607 [Penicillium argentinense]
MTAVDVGAQPAPQALAKNALQEAVLPRDRVLSTFERTIAFNAPVLESLLLQLPTDAILKLYQTSPYLRTFLPSCPTAWKLLSFRLMSPSLPQVPAHIVPPGTSEREAENPPQRQSRPYALDQLLMNVLVPFSVCLKSLELDNTAVSGQILVSTVLHARRETLEHVSVRGCKHVSLKYHIIPYLTMFGLQYDVDMEKNIGSSQTTRRLALKSLYTYRCRHHRRRPYLSVSLFRKDSDSEPTHELVNLCHKLGIWTDTAWCTTPAGRCFRRRGYVAMRVPHGSPEVWVVFDRLWRSKNWIGPVDTESRKTHVRDGKLWETSETGYLGEALGTGDGPEPGEGKMTPAHLRNSHARFVENVKCDNCAEEITERCEQCSILMHCVGCRKTLCASCAYERPYLHRGPSSTSTGNANGNTPESLWWAPGAIFSPSSMQDPISNPLDTALNGLSHTSSPALKFHWCCAEPIFSGGGGISIGSANRDVDHVRAVPLPRNQGWEDLEYTVSEWSKTFPKYAYGDPSKPDYSLETGHLAMMKWLLGPPDRKVSPCPRNLCQECYDSPQWKVHCKSCSKPLCIEHDLRGLRLRICGYKDLGIEKENIQKRSAATTLAAGVSTSQSAGFDLPFRTQRLVDSTNSSFINGPQGDAPSDETFVNTPNDDISSRTFFPRNPTRSFSAPPSNQSGSSSPSSAFSFESTFEAPRWQGCQSFFCPTNRQPGDQRQRCPSYIRECKSCLVYVCQECVQANPPCKCSYCEENYLCPNCMRQSPSDGPCRRREDEKARKERKWKKDMQELESILQLKLANEVAEFVGQFFDSVDYDHNSGPAVTLSVQSDLGRPDDITPSASHRPPCELTDVTGAMEPGLFIDPDDLPPEE